MFTLQVLAKEARDARPYKSSYYSLNIKNIASEYDQEIPQSQAADNPVAPLISTNKSLNVKFI